jgi:threonine dehydratase
VTIDAIPEQLAFAELKRAHRLSAETVSRTPMITAGSLSAGLGGRLVLKAENLQRTGSFKLRGALNKLRSIDPDRGVVAGSAGNHAQSLAYAARVFEVPCEVFMPVDAAIGKIAAARAFGALVHQRGESVDECVELARARAAERGSAFVHPFDDLDVIAGQAGVGIEIAEDEPDLAAVVVPIGGGGLASGVAAAIKQRQPQVRVIGVQAERCDPFHESIAAGRPVTVGPVSTIADGIAVKRPGVITFGLVRGLVDEVVTVPDAAIADAMALVFERSKLVVEGAGAVSLAAVMAGLVELDPGSTTVAILSGGNVDLARFAVIAGRQDASRGRRLRLATKVPDRPGGMADLLRTIADLRANLVDVTHVREHVALDVGETGVELTLETRDAQHSEAIEAALRESGYEAFDRQLQPTR